MPDGEQCQKVDEESPCPPPFQSYLETASVIQPEGVSTVLRGRLTQLLDFQGALQSSLSLMTPSSRLERFDEINSLLELYELEVATVNCLLKDRTFLGMVGSKVFGNDSNIVEDKKNRLSSIVEAAISSQLLSREKIRGGVFEFEQGKYLHRKVLDSIEKYLDQSLLFESICIGYQSFQERVIIDRQNAKFNQEDSSSINPGKSIQGEDLKEAAQ